jgi:hypothetical protein
VPFLFSSAAFLGAFLLFCVQPMIARMVLPQFGGSPSVWNTCMLFFQVGLLTGYGTVHATSRWLTPLRQSWLHLGLFALPIAALPIAFPGGPSDGGNPSLGLLARLVTAAGLPFVVVATTAPLVQRWFAATDDRSAGDPYFLYAASNAGSLLALVGYVTVIERSLTLRVQTVLWSLGYGVLGCLILACAVGLFRGRAATPEHRPGEPIAVLDRLGWMALAFAPSSLLLGVTTFLTTDLAPVPLLWVVPLALYLLSYIVAFANPPARFRRVCALALAPAVVSTLAVMVSRASIPLWATLLIHLATFFLAATACHMELSHRRPCSSQLTDFYLMIAIGGALGGLFNALIAPVLFSWVAEYPLVLAMVAALAPRAGAQAGPGRPHNAAGWLRDVAIATLPGLVAFLAARFWPGSPPVWLSVAPMVACLVFVARPIRFALSLAIVAMVGAHFKDVSRGVVLRERSFFGVLRVSVNTRSGTYILTHGETMHGMQRQTAVPSLRRVPLMYYSAPGPIGQVFYAYRSTPVVQRVGVVGLGVGSLAAYGRTGQEFTFFEVDPAVERIARNPSYFHYLEECRARVRVVVGDARLSMGREADRSYGLIVLDAFSGDAIPVHLLTCEALQLYLAKLADGGLIALHISNKYMDLESVVRDLACDAGLVGLDQNETTIPANEHSQGRMASHWIALARRTSDLSLLAGRPGWQPLGDGHRSAAWTDDHADILGVLRWR